MDAIRELERQLYPCKEVDCNDYKRFPAASEDEFAYMESESMDASYVHFFPYLRSGEEKYVELYIYDAMRSEYIRFIILDGYRLSAEDEDIFFEYLESDQEIKHAEFERFSKFSKAVFKCFMHWRYIKYTLHGLKEAFTHMYYASHPGPREILFKAGLRHIALSISKISFYNIMGTDPESILNAPMKLLRILGEPRLTDEYMTDPVLFDKAKAIYRKYSSYLNEKVLSVGQWKYLEYLYDNDGLFAGYPFMRSLFNRLEHSGQFELEEYRKYITLRDRLPIKMKNKLPKPDDIWDKASQLEILMEYTEDDEINRMIVERKTQGLYEYEGEEYVVRYPESALDFCLEALNQRNCLLENYLDDHAERETTILFLRRKNAPEKSFVTMELTNSFRISQVYGKGNSIPSKDVFEFLREYAMDKWLCYDPYTMLSIYEDEYVEDFDDEMLDYIDELSKMHEKHEVPESFPEDEDKTRYDQLCFDDCFPKWRTERIKVC